MLDALPRLRAHRAGRARARRRAGAGARGALRDAARRLLRGDAPAPGALAARGGGSQTDASSTARRRSPTSPCFGSSARRASAPTSPPRASSPSRGRPGSPAASSSSTATTRTTAFLREAALERAPVVLDSPDEAELAAAAGVERVLVRVTLGVDADTHEAVVTGHHGSKFGLPPDEARELLADALDAEARRARAARARRLAAPRLHRAGRDDPPARRVRRNLPRRARLGSPRRRPRRRLRDPPHPRR